MCGLQVPPNWRPSPWTNSGMFACPQGSVFSFQTRRSQGAGDCGGRHWPSEYAGVLGGWQRQTGDDGIPPHGKGPRLRAAQTSMSIVQERGITEKPTSATRFPTGR